MTDAGTNAAARLLAAGDPANIAIAAPEEQVTYQELRERVARAGTLWRSRGLEPTDRVGVVAADTLGWVEAYLGAIHAGGVSIAINPRLPLTDLVPILVESEIRFVFCDLPLAGPLATALAGVRPAPTIVIAGHAWRKALARASALPALARSADDPALWIGTSGTTGRPKGVIHRQSVVEESAEFATTVLGADSADRFYCSSRLFFAYALGNSLCAGLRLGATVILDPEWPTAERVLQVVAQFRPTLLFSVPTLYQKLLAGGHARALGRAGIRHFVSAGETLPATIRTRWEAATGVAPISGLGTSETLSLMLYSDEPTGWMRPVPRAEIALSRPDQPDVPQRIRIRHPCIASGYWRRPEAQADAFDDGAFSPGDTFLLHGERLEFTGRTDDMLKIAGQWVSTQWIERTLRDLCGTSVDEVVAIGATGEDGLAGIAVIAVAGGDPAAARTALAQAVAVLPKYRQPHWVHWVDGLPLTATGKVARSALRALHEAALARGLGGALRPSPAPLQEPRAGAARRRTSARRSGAPPAVPRQ